MDHQSNGIVEIFKNIFNSDSVLDDEPPGERKAQELTQRIGEFYRSTVRDAMAPRTKMITIEADRPVSEAVALIESSGFSRIPVQNGRRDNIVGILYAKDLFRFFRISEDPKVGDLMRKPYFVSYSQPLPQLFADFQKRQLHMAIVVDEYGGVGGLITLEDTIEELLGSIHDEHDEVSDPVYETGEDGVTRMDANYLLTEFNQLYNTNFQKEGVETIGGYICHRIGKIPEQGEQFELEGMRFTISERSDRNISKLQISRRENSAA